MQKSNISILNHIPDFLDYLEIERGLSNNTQKNYSRYLKKFSIWLKETNQENLLPHELTSDIVSKYRLYLARHINPKTNKSLTKITQNYYLIALRALLSYFTEKDIQSIASNKIKLPKDAKEKKIKFLTLEQVEKLLTAPDGDTPQQLRDRAILESLFSTGLRIAELVALNKDQFRNIKNKDDLEIAIIGKGNHPRVVFFSKRALYCIDKYLKTRDDSDKALFINYRSTKSENRRLTVRSIERTVKKYVVQANIPFFTTPHTLRHTMATDLLTQGVDLRTIQEFLGHQNIATTQVYTHVTNKRLRDVHKKYHSLKDPEKE